METKRKLNTEPFKTVFIQHDFDFYSVVYYHGDPSDEPVFYLKNPTSREFEVLTYSRWYMTIAFEKLRKLDRSEQSQITKELVYSFRWAIREGYNHQLDPNLRNPYDTPRIRNTIKAVKAYIERIDKASKKEMEAYK